MADETRVVYPEDAEVGASSSCDVSTTPSPSKEESAPASNPLKRQRTLVDMFAAPKNSKSEETRVPKAKRTKLDTSSSLPVVKTEAVASSGLQRLNFIAFNLNEFIESIPEEHKDLLKLECECMGKSWLKLLKDEIKKSYFISLKKFLWEEGVRGPDDVVAGLKVYPIPRNIYSWSNTPLGKVKVVIVGQDPYHGPNQAHGLCFSVPKGVNVPPSLRNIYAEIKAEYPDFKVPKHGNLSAWAENGVLMLNTCLTVRANQAGSHAGKGWEAFTDKVVDVVDKYGGANLGGRSDPDARGIGRGVVFLAWGAWAGKRVAKLDKTKHLILSSAHPSPFSAHKGFLGNGHFKAANDWLEEKYGAEAKVHWCQLDTAAHTCTRAHVTDHASNVLGRRAPVTLIWSTVALH